MEKEYDAYQYLANNNEGNYINTGPYLIVQGGTFMSINKPMESIQYITHIQNDEDIESATCPPVYDVSSQPYYVDLNVSPELMTPVTVNSIEPVTPSAVYPNNYVSPNSSGELVQNDIIDLKQSSSEEFDANKQIAGYAEVTLTDRQYEMLKEKGWILLQIKEKIFLLDTSGLHEITNNQKLVNKLKLEMVSNNNQDNGSSMNVACNESESMAYDDANVIIQRDINTSQNFLVHTEPVQPIAPSTQDQTSKEETSMQQINETTSNNTINGKKQPTNVILKSQFHVKDIPNRIILGKTANGKNLVAQVVKGKGTIKNERRADESVKSDTSTYCRMEDITLAKAVIAQLLHVPEFKTALHKHKLIITKTLIEENNKGSIKRENKETLITGQLIMDGPKAEFVYVPDMITEHVKSCELNNKSDGNVEQTESEAPNGNMFLHINITETKGADVSKILVTVKERYLSQSQMYNMKSEHLTSTFICPDCAKNFKTQEELDEHQKEKSLNKGCQMQNHLQIYEKDNDQEATDVT